MHWIFSPHRDKTKSNCQGVNINSKCYTCMCSKHNSHCCRWQHGHSPPSSNTADMTRKDSGAKKVWNAPCFLLAVLCVQTVNCICDALQRRRALRLTQWELTMAWRSSQWQRKCRAGRTAISPSPSLPADLQARPAHHLTRRKVGVWFYYIYI